MKRKTYLIVGVIFTFTQYSNLYAATQLILDDGPGKWLDRGDAIITGKDGKTEITINGGISWRYPSNDQSTAIFDGVQKLNFNILSSTPNATMSAFYGGTANLLATNTDVNINTVYNNSDILGRGSVYGVIAGSTVDAGISVDDDRFTSKHFATTEVNNLTVSQTINTTGLIGTTLNSAIRSIQGAYRDSGTGPAGLVRVNGDLSILLDGGRQEAIYVSGKGVSDDSKISTVILNGDSSFILKNGKGIDNSAIKIGKSRSIGTGEGYLESHGKMDIDMTNTPGAAIKLAVSGSTLKADFDNSSTRIKTNGNAINVGQQDWGTQHSASGISALFKNAVFVTSSLKDSLLKVYKNQGNVIFNFTGDKTDLDMQEDQAWVIDIDANDAADELYHNNVSLNLSDNAKMSGLTSIQEDSRLTINLDNNSVWLLKKNNAGTTSTFSYLTLNNGSILNANSDNFTLVGNVKNQSDSVIQIYNPEEKGFHSLTITGNYFGSDDSSVIFGTALGDDSSLTDKLIITGNATGTTKVVVNNVGGVGAETLEGIELIEVGAPNAADTFVQSSRIVAGAWDYYLQQGTKTGQNMNNWYLTSVTTPDDKTNNQKPDEVKPPEPEEPMPPEPEEPMPPKSEEPMPPTPEKPEPSKPEKPEPPVKPEEGEQHYRPEAASYASNIQAANNMFNLRLYDRLGETQYTDALTGEQKVTSMWMRHVGGHNRSSAMSDNQVKTQTNYYVVQIGGDVAQWTSTGKDRWHLGLMAGYAQQNSYSKSMANGYHSRGEVEGYSTGVYGTWFSNDEERTGPYMDAWLQYSWFRNSITGQDLPSEHYKSKGLSSSVESGYRFRVGERKTSTGVHETFWLQPEAQIIWSDVKADRHTEKNGTSVESLGDGNLQTRVGLRASMMSHSVLDNDKNRQFEPFMEINWLHNSRNYGVRMNNTYDYLSGTRNTGEVKVGVDGKVSNHLNVWGNVAVQSGKDGYSDTKGMVGLKYMF
ncbi:autotransporter outer membrane beta-barrel domain-containing protein [Citrobacter koseri]|uniref:autotransporter outer membrane beta-barrel domain-containing protein n=1 Tax=Citrobacter koseri TaxID=545 RepID=UPI0038927E9B